MSAASAVRSFVILGATASGRPFRPSDWAERLAGVMAGFRPPGVPAGLHIGYSPYVMPGIRDGVRCVRVDARLHAMEPMAYDFARRFAADNALQVIEE
jgi:hypothetical protein